MLKKYSIIGDVIQEQKWNFQQSLICRQKICIVIWNLCVGFQKFANLEKLLRSVTQSVSTAKVLRAGQTRAVGNGVSVSQRCPIRGITSVHAELGRRVVQMYIHLSLTDWIIFASVSKSVLTNLFCYLYFACFCKS